VAINEAQDLVEKSGDLPVPLSIRNAKTGLMKSLNYGKGYGYSHDGEGNFILQEFLPEAIAGTKLYDPGDNAAEERARQFLRERWGDKYEY
jgi:putative ATPase